MAHPDPTVDARDRDIEAMHQCWMDLSARYDMPPASPSRSMDLDRTQALKPNHQDQDTLRRADQVFEIPDHIGWDSPTLF